MADGKAGGRTLGRRARRAHLDRVGPPHVKALEEGDPRDEGQYGNVGFEHRIMGDDSSTLEGIPESGHCLVHRTLTDGCREGRCSRRHVHGLQGDGERGWRTTADAGVTFLFEAAVAVELAVGSAVHCHAASNHDGRLGARPRPETGCVGRRRRSGEQ